MRFYFPQYPDKLLTAQEWVALRWKREPAQEDAPTALPPDIQLDPFCFGLYAFNPRTGESRRISD